MHGYSNQNCSRHDFSEQVLRNVSFSKGVFTDANFRNSDLRGANFEGADLRGANFEGAKLSNVNFQNARMGLSPRNKTISEISVILMAFFLGIITTLTAAIGSSVLYSKAPSDIVIGTLFIVLFITLSSITAWQGIKVAQIAISILVCLALSLVIVLALTISTSGAGGDTVLKTVNNALQEIGNILVPVALAGACAFTIAVMLILLLMIALTVGVAISEDSNFPGKRTSISTLIGSLLGVLLLTYLGHGILTSLLSLAICLITVILGNFIGQLTASKSSKFTFLRRLSNIIAAIGGTRLNHTDLTRANLSKAKLANTNFRNSTLTHVYWRDSSGISLALFGSHYLSQRKIQNLVVNSEKINSKNFNNLDLNGINLTGFNLSNFIFTRTKLNNALLKKVDLSFSKLDRTELDKANLQDAILTGACIGNWDITEATILEGVVCKYYFMRVPTDDDSERLRRPRSGNFKNFDQFIYSLSQSLTLYINKHIDPKVLEDRINQVFQDDSKQKNMLITEVEEIEENKRLFHLDTSIALQNSQLLARIVKLLEHTEEDANKKYSDTNVIIGTYYQQGDFMPEEKNIEIRNSQIGALTFGNSNQIDGSMVDNSSSLDSSSNQLQEVAKQIQDVLNQIAKPDSDTSAVENANVAAQAVEKIEKNKQLRRRIVSVLKSAGKEALEQLVDHPAIKIFLAAVEGWEKEV